MFLNMPVEGNSGFYILPAVPYSTAASYLCPIAAYNPVGPDAAVVSALPASSALTCLTLGLPIKS